MELFAVAEVLAMPDGEYTEGTRASIEIRHFTTVTGAQIVEIRRTPCAQAAPEVLPFEPEPWMPAYPQTRDKNERIACTYPGCAVGTLCGWRGLVAHTRRMHGDEAYAELERRRPPAPPRPERIAAPRPHVSRAIPRPQQTAAQRCDMCHETPCGNIIVCGRRRRALAQRKAS